MTPSKRCRFFVVTVLCVLASQPRGQSQIPTIQLSALSPAVGQAASSFAVRVSEGQLTDEVDQLIFSNSAIVAKLQTTAPRLLETSAQPKYGNFDVTITPEVVPGVYEVRAHGRHGLSNPRAFLVTQSPVHVVDQEHTTSSSSLDLSLQQVTVDRTFPQRRNYYKVTLAEGDRLFVCGHARRLDSRAVIALALLDPNGREVARGRAVGEFPAEILHKVTLPGTYTLLAYDFLFQGGEEFSYALQAVVDAATAGVEDVCAKVDCELKRLCATSGESKSISNSALVGLKPHASEPAAVAAQWLSPTVASNAANAGERAVPFTEFGEFTDSKPSYVLDFKATAGQSLWVEVNSAKLDQLTDPRTIVYKVNRDPNGNESLQQLAEQDDAATLGTAAMKLRMRDPYLQFTAPENATYRILLADNQTGVRPAGSRNFVLTVREAQPAFELLAYLPFPSKDVAQSKNWASNLARGGTETVHVRVTRRDGFNEAIEVIADGLPAGVACEKAIIPAGASEAMLILQAAEDAVDATAAVRVVGRSSGATQLERVAMFGTIVRGATPTRNTIESRLAADLGVRANASEFAPLLVTLGDCQTLEMARGGKLPIPVKVVRRAGGAGKCTLRPQHLPPKCTLAEIAIEGDKAEGSGELVVAPDAPIGEYTFWMQNETTVKWRPNPQSLTAEEAYVEKLKAASADPAQAAAKPMIDEALKVASERVEQLKKATAERDVVVYFATTPVRIRIVEFPVRLASPEVVAVASGAETQMELKIERLFGFADAVDLSLAGKASLEGLEVAGAQIPAGMELARLVIKIPPAAQAMTVAVPIKMDCKFNGHALSHTVNVNLQISPQAAQ